MEPICLKTATQRPLTLLCPEVATGCAKPTCGSSNAILWLFLAWSPVLTGRLSRAQVSPALPFIFVGLRSLRSYFTFASVTNLSSCTGEGQHCIRVVVNKRLIVRRDRDSHELLGRLQSSYSCCEKQSRDPSEN